MSTDDGDGQRYRFGGFTLDPASVRLTRGASEVSLTPKAFELLTVLVRGRHRALTKQQLLDAVWPATAVIENTLTQRIKEIREALGDSPRDPVFVRTIPRVGFQFIAETTVEAAGAPAAALAGGMPLRPTEQVSPMAAEAAGRPVPNDGNTSPFNRRLVAALGLIVLLVAGALLAASWRRDAPPRPNASGRRVMLAVLPFENLSADPDEGYFSDGLTEELIAEFGRLDPDGLGVIARTSAMTYKGTTKSAAQIAGELGVDYIFEGSVRREGDRVRIVAQLIRCSDQTHLWADRFDRDVGSVLSLQAEVARQIAVRTRVSLSGAAGLPGRPVTVHPEAYQAYLKGRFFLNQRTGDAIEKALEQFQQAIATDPTYAQAYAGLADAHELLGSYANGVPSESFRRGLEAARRALELDPDRAEPYISLGTIHTSHSWDWAEAERAFQRALALNPSSAPAHKGYGELLSFLARHDQAIAQLSRAVELDPLSLLMRSNLGIIYWRARRYDEAMREMIRTLDLDPNYMLGHLNVGLIHTALGAYPDASAAFQRASSYSPRFADPLGLLGHALGRAGRIADARAAGDQLLRLSSEMYVSGYVRALYHLGLDERDQALTELESAYKDRSWHVVMLKVDPLLDSLRSEPRFQDLLKELRFPE